MPLEIRVLGPLEVLVDGVPLRVDTRKAEAILALLAVEGRPFARDELAALFWPESDDESARGALRRTLSVLRAALGDRWLRVDRAAVALGAAADVSIDIVALERAVAQGTPSALAAAAALARGPFLAGFSIRDSAEWDDWRATRSATVERRVVHVLELLAAAAEAAGDSAAAVDAASRLVELDPLDEPARRRLMRLLAAGGDRAGAIREYRATVAVLERELGVVPLAATTELYEAIRDERLAVSAAPAGVAIADVAAVTPLVPVAAQPLPMLGREADLDRLLAAHRGAASGGRLALVTGEAGIGKSRLAEALTDRVASGGGVALVARAFPAESAIAYAPVLELLRSGFAHPEAGPRLARLPASARTELERIVALPEGVGAVVPAQGGDQPAARARLLDAIASALTALAAGPVPAVIVVEDVQWADDASRETLLYLARRLGVRPLLLLVTWRPEDLDDRGRAFAAVLASMPATTIRLDRLAPDAVRALVAAAAGAGLVGWDPEALWAESEGLPLYLVEALAAGPGAMGDGPPRGVRALLRERLASASETAGQVLAAAAVIGRSFDLETVRGASGRSEDETITALEELVRRAIVREVASGGEPAFDFGHARLRDAAYEDIGLARRRLLHRRVAEILRADAAGRDDPGRLAQVAGHELAGGREAAAAETFLEAGLRAQAVYANREALEHLETALALGAPDVARLQVAIGELRTALGDYAGAIAALEAAAAVATGGDLAGIELRLGRVHARRGDMATAASHLDASLAGLADGPDHRELRAIALVERGAVALRAGHLELATELADQALAAPGRAPAASVTPGAPGSVPSRDTLAARSRMQGAASRLGGLVALRRGDIATARDLLARSVAAVAVDDDPGAGIAARNALALVEAADGDREAAVVLLEEALAECRRTGETHLEAAVENNLADQLHALGRGDEAMVHLKRAVALFAEVGGTPGELEPEIWKLVSW